MYTPDLHSSTCGLQYSSPNWFLCLWQLQLPVTDMTTHWAYLLNSFFLHARLRNRKLHSLISAIHLIWCPLGFVAYALLCQAGGPSALPPTHMHKHAHFFLVVIACLFSVLLRLRQVQELAWDYRARVQMLSQRAPVRPFRYLIWCHEVLTNISSTGPPWPALL